MLIKKDVLVLNGQKLVQSMQVHKQLMLQIMSECIAAHQLLCLFVQLAIDKNQRLIKMLNFHDEESVVHTVLEDFYAVGALADELTHGFHMEERGYIDRTEVNSRLIAFARELERILDKWETHATLIA